MEKRRKLVSVLMLFFGVSVSFAAVALRMTMVQSISEPRLNTDSIWVEPLLTDMLQKSDMFTIDVMVNITDPVGNATGLWGYDYKLKWNTTLIEAVNITYHNSLNWTNIYVVKDYVNSTGYHWLAVSALSPSVPFTGVASLCTYVFHVLYQPYEPDPSLVGILDIYDDKLADDEATEIIHGTYDGQYSISSLPCSFIDELIIIIGNQTVNPCQRISAIEAAINNWLHDWKGILPNETIPETTDIYNTFLDRGDRLLQTLEDIQLEPSYEGPSSSDWNTQRKGLIDMVVEATMFVRDIMNIAIANVNINIQLAPVFVWIGTWRPDVDIAPEELAIPGYVTHSSAFVIVKELKGLAWTVGTRLVWITPSERFVNVTCITLKYAEFIKTITYEYVYENQAWSIQQTIDKQKIYEEELDNFVWFFKSVKDP